MKRLIRSLAAAAVATAAVSAAPALADGRRDYREHRGDEPCHTAAPVVVYRPGRPAPPPPPVRWERRELRREYAELEQARHRFYATWNGSPGKQRKFERWYAHEKAELDRKWMMVAYR